MNAVRYGHQQIFPSKVVCIGRNYVEHIEELGNEIPAGMVVFNKPNSAISDRLYFVSEDTRFEGEITFLIQKGKIAGVGFGLDLTRATLQNYLKSKGLPWERAKAFDCSAVLSEFVPFRGELDSLSMKLYVNDVLVQFATYKLMMYKPQTMLNEIESFMHLEDGDVIMSGTPKGVGTYAAGDRFLGQIYSYDVLILEKNWEVETKNVV
ncbi:MAG: fumarylacetoacetate hydrolase family protein [Sulfurovum sp.]|nr:fumarylacetoacetate hydrolase family protein [Sulfurovum sp.]